MRVNADFNRRAIVCPAHYTWTPSPQPGVRRVMLDRIGEEKARATSIVAYAPDSAFPSHHHPGGEEILVLEGVFSEGNRHHPAGSYLRNPPGSSHRPSSKEGALIFVKLRQMRETERESVKIDTRDPAAWRLLDDRRVCPLYADPAEVVALHRLPPRAPLFVSEQADTQALNEILVLDGELWLGARSCQRGAWIRLPAGDVPPDLAAGAGGATVYLKQSAAAMFAGLSLD